MAPRARSRRIGLPDNPTLGNNQASTAPWTSIHAKLPEFVQTLVLLSHETRQTRSNTAAKYERDRPETTLFYQVIEKYWSEFQAELAIQGKTLPIYATEEFDAYLKCGKLEHGFLGVRSESCLDEKLVTFSCKKRGLCPGCGA